MTRSQTFRIFETSSVLLFFIQSLKTIFSVLFGIIYDGVFEGPFTNWLVISIVLLLISFLLPMLFSNLGRGKDFSLLAGIAAVGRIALCINIADVRYWGALVTILGGVLYLTALFRTRREYAMQGFVIALCMDQFLRLVGFTYDISLRPWWLPVQLIWLLLIVYLGRRMDQEEEEVNVDGRTGLGLPGGVALGGFLFLQTSLLSLPNAISRWSDVVYEWVALVLLILTISFLFPNISKYLDRMMKGVWIRLGFLIILILGLMGGYFVSGVLPALGLLVAHVLSIALFRHSLRSLAAGKSGRGYPISVGLVLFLILNFLNAFAFTYPYTLPAMREMGWTIFLVAGFALGMAIARADHGEKLTVELPSRAFVPLLGIVLVAIIFVLPMKADDLPDTGTLRAATYNIHYGYDDEWHYTLDKIASTIEENDCDVVAMQEVDTGRMTSYLVDNAYYLSRTLKMQVAYLPAVEHLTGIGILYRGPKVEEEFQLVTSLQEQTGIIGLTLGKTEHPVYAFGIWMGLSKEDTNRQIREALEFIGDRTPATFGGDFNADPESDVATAIRDAGFQDPFMMLATDPAPSTSPAIKPERRIDFVWVRGMQAASAWVPESLASDHRMVVVEVKSQP